MKVFENLDQALIGMSKELMEGGIKRGTRGYTCFELPHPVIICITNPSDRYVTIPERKWNKVLPFAESLWLALGLNDLDALPGAYVKNLYNFSDNGRTWRAGYGPRMRGFTGLDRDYDVSDVNEKYCFSGHVRHTDQLKFVIDTLKKDPNSRQALITIHDPAKDCFDVDNTLKITKDQPCTRSIHFQITPSGKLDCIVDLRSNDVLWGFSAVNVFNFTMMQEYVANILGVEVGNYYHKADNFHYYDNMADRVGELAYLNPAPYGTFEKFQYSDKFVSLEDFDEQILKLYEYEQRLRSGDEKWLVWFDNDMIYDWARVFYQHWTKGKVEFKNPYLNKLFNS